MLSAVGNLVRRRLVRFRFRRFRRQEFQIYRLCLIALQFHASPRRSFACASLRSQNVRTLRQSREAVRAFSRGVDPERFDRLSRRARSARYFSGVIKENKGIGRRPALRNLEPNRAARPSQRARESVSLTIPWAASFPCWRWIATVVPSHHSEWRTPLRLVGRQRGCRRQSTRDRRSTGGL